MNVEIVQNQIHPVFDIISGKRTNLSRDLSIGNHVWIGQNATLLNGLSVGDHSIIGYGTVTAGKFGNNVTVVGNPGRVIRENVTWSRELTGYCEISELL